MKKISLIVLIFSNAVSANLKEINIVYGVDNRMEVYEANEVAQKIAKSTAGMIMTSSMIDLGVNIMLPPSPISQTHGLCKDERFSDQPTSLSCSGFLVGEDLLVTAGHCIRDESRCQNVSWVFDFKIDSKTNRADIIISKENVYKCKEIIESKLVFLENDIKDYALIRLDRSVPNRKPLKFRKTGKIENNALVTVIGHPSGLPMKVTTDGQVYNNLAEGFFVTNLDTFGGNSGSPVFNSETGLVEGILVRGQKDYVKEKECKRVNVEPEDSVEKFFAGEAVSRITDLNSLMKMDL